jgi:hypothetical protein
MSHHEESELGWAAFKVALLWFIGIVAHNYHIIAGNILVTLSIAYLVWKWWRDIKKEKIQR